MRRVRALLGAGADTPWVHARKVTATGIGLGHLALAGLAGTGHLTPSAPSSFPVLAAVTENPAWLFVHAACAAVIAWSLLRNRGQVTAMSMSAGWMGAWGALTLLAGLSAVDRISLAGPVLGLAFAVTSYSVAMAWAVAPHLREAVAR